MLSQLYLKWGNREFGIIFQKEIAFGKKKIQKTKKETCFPFFFSTTVAMRNTRQVTNQSSHGELSFHHNPHLRHCWGLHLPTSRVTRRRGARLKHAAHFTYCHCCELCALKQKPGVLLEKSYRGVKPPETHTQIPNADRTHHRIRSPSIECSGT